MVHSILLAQTSYQNRLKGLRGAFDNKHQDPADITMIFVFIGVLGALVVLILVAQHIRQRMTGRTEPNYPTKLFSRVMKKMGLGLKDRMIMQMVARGGKIAQPTILFFNRDFFKQHTDMWTKSISFRPWQGYVKDRIEAITEVVFENETITDNPPPPATA